MAEQIFLNYQEMDEAGKLVGAKSLPFHLGVMGTFSGNPELESHDDSFDLNRSNFNYFFSKLNVQARGFLPNRLYPGVGFDFLEFTIHFQKFQDFNPQHLANHLDFFKGYLAFVERFEKCLGKSKVSVADYFEPEDKLYLQSFGLTSETLTALEIIKALANASERLQDQFNELLYHPGYQELEFNWRSLWMLLNTLDLKDSKLSVIDTRRDLMEMDLAAGLSVTETEMFRLIYTEEADQYGGTPFNMMLNTYVLGQDDVEMAKTLAMIGKMSGCAMVSTLDAALFGIESEDYFGNQFDYSDLKQNQDYSPWDELAGMVEGRYCSFLVQRVCARDPYPIQTIEGLRFELVDRPPDEKILEGLYGPAVYIFSIPFIQTYNTYHSTISVDEPGTNHVPLTCYARAKESTPLSYTPLERVQEAMAQFGLLSLAINHEKKSFKIGPMNQFNASVSLDKGVSLSVEERVNVRLPQLLFVCQLSHYMRMIQRQSVAKFQPQQLKSELNSWLRRFVSDGTAESAAIRSQRPLKRAEVNLVELQTKTGQMLEFQLTIVPHMKYNGLDYELTL